MNYTNSFDHTAGGKKNLQVSVSKVPQSRVDNEEKFRLDCIPSISVVIPLYNKAKHIAQTLDSVIKQSFPPAEIIVVDDGSTDAGAEIVKGFANVRLVQQGNAGVSAARNRGVAESRGDFVAFLDADDQWLPHFLEEIIHLIKTFPQAGFFATSYQFCTAVDQYQNPKIRFRSEPQGPRILDDYFAVGARGDLPFMMSSIAIRRTDFEVIGLFPLGEPMGEDQDFFCRAALRSAIAYSPRVMAIYHLDATNRACTNRVPSEECPFSLRLRQWASLTENAQLRSSMKDYCAAHVIHLASLNVRSGHFCEARTLLATDLAKRNLLRNYWWLLRCGIAEILADNGGESVIN